MHTLTSNTLEVNVMCRNTLNAKLTCCLFVNESAVMKPSHGLNLELCSSVITRLRSDPKLLFYLLNQYGACSVASPLRRAVAAQ